MLTIITPKKYIPTIKKPLIFLAGPIRGAPAWQDEAIDIFLKKGYEGFLVNPSRTLAQRHEQHGALGCEQHFTRQRAWEHHYLTLARKEAPQGAIMFYLIGEQHHRCEKSYAAMTRLELGQHMTEYQKDPSSRICIGSPAEKEQQMSELDTITYDLSRYMPHTVHQRAQDRFDLNLQGLEATCDEALRIASRKTP